MTTSPLPSGSPMLQSRRQNQKCPTSGRGGYITPAIWGVPNASGRGTNSQVPHKWAWWLHHPCNLGSPQRFTAGDKIRSGPQLGLVAASPLLSGGSPTLRSGGQNQKCPASGLGGYMAHAVGRTPRLQSGGQNQKWPTSGPGGNITGAIWGGGGGNCFRAGDKIRSSPQVSLVTTSPPLSVGGGSPML